MKATTFYTEIQNLNKAYKNIDLEKYLLALYREVLKNKERKLTYNLLFTMLKNAFTTKPYLFNKEWLTCNEPPDDNRINHKFTNPDFTDLVDKTNTSYLEPFDFTLETLKFQIADLHKMKGKQLEDKYRFYGIDSETGYRWYNFEPLSNLSCGVRCFIDNELFLEEIDWGFIGDLFENGRIYE